MILGGIVYAANEKFGLFYFYVGFNMEFLNLKMRVKQACRLSASRKPGFNRPISCLTVSICVNLVLFFVHPIKTYKASTIFGTFL